MIYFLWGENALYPEDTSRINTDVKMYYQTMLLLIVNENLHKLFFQGCFIAFPFALKL